MTRINGWLLVQRVDDLIVLLDETTGTEIAVSLEEATRLSHALHYLTTSAPFLTVELPDPERHT